MNLILEDCAPQSALPEWVGSASMDSSLMWNNVATLASGLLSGLGAVAGALWAISVGFKKLERQEVRRKQVQCIVSLYGSRGAIALRNTSQLDNEQRFYFELNKVGVLFADSRKVKQCLRDFRESSSTENLVALVKAMCECVDINASSLTKDDVLTVLTPQRNDSDATQ